MLMDRQKRKLNLFEELLCKEPSKQTERLLQEMIDMDPHLNDQYVYLLTAKDRLSVLVYAIIKQPPNSQKALRLLMQLCQSLGRLPAKELIPVWKALYLQHDTAAPNRFALFYEALSTFCFGGSNRKSQNNSLAILNELFVCMKERNDNQLLHRTSQDFCRNFLKFNIMEVSYVHTMNTLLSFTVPVDLFSVVNRYIYYTGETRKKEGMHEMQVELLIGLERCGQRMLSAAYLIGSIHEQVLDCIDELLASAAFVVRNAARKAISTWNKVRQRVQRQALQKEVKVEDSQADLDQMIEHRVQQNENQSKLLNFIEASEKYAATKRIAQRKALNSLVSDYKELRAKEFLRKKTGNGGGYITVDQPQKSFSKLYSKYESVLSQAEEVRELPSKQGYYVEHDDYSSKSHMSSKYDLEKTVQYPDYTEDNDLMVQKLLGTPSAQLDLSVLQIERLIDLAYSRYKDK